MKIEKTPRGKSYCCTGHAVQRMVQRGIGRRSLEDAIDDYDVRFSDKKGNPCLVKNLGDGRRIRVVTLKDSNPLVVLTVVVLEGR